MTTPNLDQLVAQLPRTTSAMRMRLRHVGSVMDFAKLESQKFECIDVDSRSFSRWAKAFERGDRHVVLDLDPNGVLCRLQLSIYVYMRDRETRKLRRCVVSLNGR